MPHKPFEGTSPCPTANKICRLDHHAPPFGVIGADLGQAKCNVCGVPAGAVSSGYKKKKHKGMKMHGTIQRQWGGKLQG